MSSFIGVILMSYFCSSCGINSDYSLHDKKGIKCIYLKCECLCHE